MKTILVEYHDGEVKLFSASSLKALKYMFMKENIRYKRMRIDGSKRWVLSGRKWSAS